MNNNRKNEEKTKSEREYAKENKAKFNKTKNTPILFEISDNKYILKTSKRHSKLFDHFSILSKRKCGRNKIVKLLIHFTDYAHA